MSTKKALMAVALCVSAMAGFAHAGGPGKYTLCHNIGGPRDLGANCDGTGDCTYQLEGGGFIAVAANHFLGIVIGTESEAAVAAHLAHGDGFVITAFDPPLHLASVIGVHRASNVECMARRAITTQPPEPGN